MSLWRAALFVAFAAFVTTRSSQASEPWPTRNVTVVVPFGPSGAADGAARLFADRLSKRWGRAVVVENRPGAEAILGTGAFVRAQDDHALLYSAASVLTVTPLVQDNLPFDASRDFVPISATCSAVFVLAINKDVHAAALNDLVRIAKAEPGKLLWSSAPGLPRYAFAAFLKQQGIDMVYVPYRDVAIPQADLGEGRLHVLLTTQHAVIAPVQSGKASIIAVTNKQRGPLLSQVPTVGEAGFAELTVDGLSGFFGPRGMPASLQEKIAADVKAVADEPELRSRIEALGQQIIGSTPGEFVAAIDEQRGRVEAVARIINLKAAGQ